MPVHVTYPGVYIEEIPSGVRTITGVATSITAFVGRAKRGAIHEPLVVNNFGDFERIFGGLWKESSLGYAVRDFFQNGGGQAVIVRVHNNAQTSRFRLTMGSKEHVLEAANPGAWGNSLRAEAVPVTLKGKSLEDLKKSLDVETHDDLYNVTIKHGNARNPDEVIATETFSNVIGVQPAHPRFIGNVLNNESSLARIDDDNTGSAAGVPDVPTDSLKTKIRNLSSLLAENQNPLDNSVGQWNAGAVGNWLLALSNQLNELDLNEFIEKFKEVVSKNLDDLKGNQDLTTTIDQVKTPPITASELAVVANAIDAGNLTQQTAISTAQLALFAQDTAQAASEQAVIAEAKVQSTLAMVNTESPEISKKDACRIALEAVREVIALARQLVSGEVRDGSDGDVLSRESFAGSDFDSENMGLYALRKTDFNLLCIPPYNGTGDVDNEVLTKAIALCKESRAFLILDPPSTWTSVSKAREGIESFLDPSEYAAVFFPRLRQPDPLRNGQMADFAPCGAVAGVMARTDTQRGVWKAPAGLDANLSGVPQLSLTLTDGENGQLNPLGINCLRSLPAAGRVIWGARTRRGDDRLTSEWKYIPIRRLANYIEESLYRGTQWVVFEPNDEPLWSQIRLNVGAFMHNLYRQRAFQGSSPREAYFVKCDKETTTQNDINLGIVHIVVGFMPLKPAEFVILQIQQMAGKVDV